MARAVEREVTRRGEERTRGEVRTRGSDGDELESSGKTSHVLILSYLLFLQVRNYSFLGKCLIIVCVYRICRTLRLQIQSHREP